VNYLFFFFAAFFFLAAIAHSPPLGARGRAGLVEKCFMHTALVG
jgi:hypothetical protein